MNIIDALQNLTPGASWTLNGTTYNDLVWHDVIQSKPTEQAVNDWITANNYRNQRKNEYPSWREFADAIYWKEKGDSSKLTTYLAACDAVKTTYPKP